MPARWPTSRSCGLILDGTVVRVRLDRKATSVSLLVVIRVRADEQKVTCGPCRVEGASGRSSVPLAVMPTPTVPLSHALGDWTRAIADIHRDFTG
jgi:hypothetical protein